MTTTRNIVRSSIDGRRKKFQKYDADTLIQDMFVKGHVDMAIFQPVYLTDFYKEPFGDIEKNALLAKQYDGRFISNGSFDPRDGERGLEYLDYLVETHGIIGAKLYTAEWRGTSKGYKLTDPWTERYLEKCEKLGIVNIHIHKGPTITPLNKDAFDVADIDEAASNFQGLNFIVEHCGLPRIEDFCWIATQESNVYAGLAVIMPFLHSRPRYFAEIISELLFWLVRTESYLEATMRFGNRAGSLRNSWTLNFRKIFRKKPVLS